MPPDHVHLLLQVRPRYWVSELMRTLKGGTSRFRPDGDHDVVAFHRHPLVIATPHRQSRCIRGHRLPHRLGTDGGVQCDKLL